LGVNCLLPYRLLTNSNQAPYNAFFWAEFMKYPYKTEEQKKRCQELQEKADRAANNIKYAKNKKLAVRSFLQYLYLSI